MHNNTDASRLEKGKISAFQLSLLSITAVIATADVFLPSYVAQEAQQDSWISVILGTASSMLIVMMFLALGLSFPDKTIIQYSCDILGKPLGKLVGFIYLYYLVDIGSAVAREIFVTAFNPESPLIIYPLITLLVASYAVTKGLEVIARVNEFILPAGIGILAFLAIVNIHESDVRNFLPIMTNGILPPVKGGILIQSWLLEIVIILQLVPYVRDKKNIKKYTAISVGILGLSMALGVLIFAVFGRMTGRLLFPALEYARFANIGEYVKNLDITIMAVWITGMFIKAAIIYYAIVLGLSQLCGLKTYKTMILPVGLVLLSISMATSERIVSLYNFLHRIMPFYSFFVAFAIPALLLAVAKIRGLPRARRQEN
jgi:spore germination protein KB